jgi:predicted membrane-bound spermidine synthase
MIPGSRLLFWLVIACFFGSGCAGLVYQIVWARYLGLFLGHSSYAVVVVLASFMGGLALGNAWLGRRADAVRSPLAWYGWIEIAIGVYALGFPLFYHLLQDSFVGVASALGAGAGSRLGLKFVFGFLSLILPTVLMGATLPLLTRALVGRLDQLKQRLALLYGWNSAGALAGCLVGDFWWIPTLGLPGATWAAAGLNLAAGVAALWISRFPPGSWLPMPSSDAKKPGPEERTTDSAPPAYSGFEMRLAVLGAGISGFAAMLYEVVWTRLLALVLGSSTHAFSLMLMAVIGGIATGSAIVARWRRDRGLLDAFGWAQAVLGLVLLVSMSTYALLPYGFAKLGLLIARREEAYPVYAFLQALVCVVVIFGPALCLGVALPLAGRVATSDVRWAGRRVGLVFGVNTAGTVLGTVLTGLWLLPALGLARTFVLGAFLNLALAMIILRRERWRHRPSLLAWAAPAGVVAVTMGGWWFQEDWQESLTSGLWRSAQPPATVAAFRAQLGRDRMAYYRDGAGATVNVSEALEGGRTNLTLKVNGKPDASNGGDMKTQLLVGHLPMLLHPQAKEVLVVGLGSGVTAGAVARHPSLERLDVVEISPEVAEAAALFSQYNDDALHHPRVHLEIEDAKTFLLLTPRLYDVIISEPSNPWMAGVAGVFTQEFFLSCQDRLRTNGLMVQWVQTYESNDQAFNIVVRTFSSVFPYVSLWQCWQGDLLLVGSAEPRAVDLAAARARFDHPAIGADLARVGLTSFPFLLAHEMVTPQHTAFLAPDETPVHTDLRPVLEYVAQRAFFVRGQAARWQEVAENDLPRATTLLGRYLRQQALGLADYRSMAESVFASQFFSAPLARSILQRWLAEAPQDPKATEFLARLGEHPSAHVLDASRLAPHRSVLIALAKQDPRPLRYYGLALLGQYREQRNVLYRPATNELVEVLEQLSQTDANNRRLYQLHLAEIAWDGGDDAACLALGQPVFEVEMQANSPSGFALDPAAPRAVLARLAESRWRQGDLPAAWDWCRLAQTGGYLEGGGAEGARLRMIWRKVRAFALALSQQTPPPG